MAKEIALVQDNSWSDSKLNLLKTTICKGSTNDEFELFLHACKRTGLDPFMKQIHAVKRKCKKPDGSWGETMTIQTGIDGFRLIADRTGKYSPGQEPTFTIDESGKLISSTAYIKKLTTDGTWHIVSASAYFDEYAQMITDKQTGERKPGDFWARMPRTMLAKCAETLAIRKAFPAELSGIYSFEEMGQAQNIEVENIKDVQKTLTDEQVETYYKSYGEEKDEFKEYINYVSEAKSWDIKKTIEECMKNHEKVREKFYSWLARQRPAELEQKAQGE